MTSAKLLLPNQLRDPTVGCTVKMQPNDAIAINDHIQRSLPDQLAPVAHSPQQRANAVLERNDADNKCIASHVIRHLGRSDYERLRALTALYEQPSRTARRPMYRMILTLVTFVVGTSGGLAAAWWTTTSGHHPDRISSGQSEFVSGAPASLVFNEHVAASTRRGLNTSELPYDGGPVSQVSTVMPKINPGELPYDGMSQKSSEIGHDAGNERAGHVTAIPKKEALAGSGVKNDMQSRATQRKAMKGSQRHRSRRSTMKEREFERLRQQADEELKKRHGATETSAHSSRASSDRRGRGKDPRHASDYSSKTQALLAKCEHAGNFIQREQCKWQLCKGMWGRNGCPSYARATPY